MCKYRSMFFIAVLCLLLGCGGVYGAENNTSLLLNAQTALTMNFRQAVSIECWYTQFKEFSDAQRAQALEVARMQKAAQEGQNEQADQNSSSVLPNLQYQVHSLRECDGRFWEDRVMEAWTGKSSQVVSHQVIAFDGTTLRGYDFLTKQAWETPNPKGYREPNPFDVYLSSMQRSMSAMSSNAVKVDVLDGFTLTAKTAARRTVKESNPISEVGQILCISIDPQSMLPTSFQDNAFAVLRNGDEIRSPSAEIVAHLCRDPSGIYYPTSLEHRVYSQRDRRQGESSLDWVRSPDRLFVMQNDQYTVTAIVFNAEIEAQVYSNIVPETAQIYNTALGAVTRARGVEEIAVERVREELSKP